MSPEPPIRVLFLRPDTYGDLFLFEPVLRMVRHVWPRTEVAVLIRKPYEDAVPLFPAEGVRWLTTDCDPYRGTPGENRAALQDLRVVLQAFAPDCVVAACAEQTWLEPAVATFLPQARQVSLGSGLTDLSVRASLDAVLAVEWPKIYPEKIPVESELQESEKNHLLARALLGSEVPGWQPAVQVPAASRATATQILAEFGLPTGGFVACAAAGTTNVQIKSWPPEHYGETLAWLESERGIRALLIGHASEREHLETVRAAARRHGANPALWVGRDGEMPIVAGLLEAAGFYFGNDTGALHLAAALGRPVVPVFGGGHWPRFQPAARRSLTVVQPLPCFGCAWDCYFVDAPCIRTISPASVRQALEQFLGDDAAGQTVFEAKGLDAGARALIDAATPRLRFLREDRAARGKQIVELTAWLLKSEGQPQAARTADEEMPTDADPAMVADWELRLQSSRTQELAAHTKARRLARELGLAQRLLKFFFGESPPAGSRPRSVLVTTTTARLPRLRAALVRPKVLFHIDACQHQGAFLVVSGWGFRRAHPWDGRTTTVTVIFRHGTKVHHTPANHVPRPDVASHFAAQRAGLAGGARGLEGAGFACEIPVDLLSPGVDWEMVLRLECAGRVCEQPTGTRLWL